MSKITLICTNSVHGSEGRIWESKQSDRDLSEVRCSKRGSTRSPEEGGGCGETGFVKKYSDKATTKPKATGSDFEARLKKIHGERTQKQQEVQREVTRSKNVKVGQNYLISDFMIKTFHQGCFLVLRDFLGVEIVITPAIEEELMIRARDVVALLTFETTPLNAYLMVWGSILAPPLIRKIVGLFLGGKPNEEKDSKLAEGET